MFLAHASSLAWVHQWPTCGLSKFKSAKTMHVQEGLGSCGSQVVPAQPASHEDHAAQASAVAGALPSPKSQSVRQNPIADFRVWQACHSWPVSCCIAQMPPHGYIAAPLSRVSQYFWMRCRQCIDAALETWS